MGSTMDLENEFHEHGSLAPLQGRRPSCRLHHFLRRRKGQEWFQIHYRAWRWSHGAANASGASAFRAEIVFGWMNYFCAEIVFGRMTHPIFLIFTRLGTALMNKIHCYY